METYLLKSANQSCAKFLNLRSLNYKFFQMPVMDENSALCEYS